MKAVHLHANKERNNETKQTIKQTKTKKEEPFEEQK